MEFSKYYVMRSLQDLQEACEITESVDHGFNTAEFVRDNRKKTTLKKHVLDLSRKYPHIRNCDVEDAVLEALAEVSKKKPSTEFLAKKVFKSKVKEYLSEISKKGKDTKRSLSCIKSVKSLSMKGVDLDGLIGRAKSILTGKERMALELCSSGHSVRDMASIMRVSFPTAWRILNRGLDKIRVSHGMRSRNKDRR